MISESMRRETREHVKRSIELLCGCDPDQVNDADLDVFLNVVRGMYWSKPFDVMARGLAAAVEAEFEEQGRMADALAGEDDAPVIDDANFFIVEYPEEPFTAPVGELVEERCPPSVRRRRPGSRGESAPICSHGRIEAEYCEECVEIIRKAQEGRS